MKNVETSDDSSKSKGIVKKIIIVLSLVGAYLTGNHDVINQLINLL